MNKAISGFSKLSKQEKIDWIAKTYFSNPTEAVFCIQKYWNSDPQLQQLHDDFIENSLTNFYLPFGIAPNFLINNKMTSIPMVIEESSVVAAASKAAKYWSTRGGFTTTVINTEKIGQVHFTFIGDFEKLTVFFEKIKAVIISETNELTKNMRQRGGGVSPDKRRRPPSKRWENTGRGAFGLGGLGVLAVQCRILPRDAATNTTFVET